MEVFSISEGPNSMCHYWAAFSCCVHLTPSVVFLSLCRLRSTACLWFSVSVFLLSVSHVSRSSLKTDPLLANIQYFICSKLGTSSFYLVFFPVRCYENLCLCFIYVSGVCAESFEGNGSQVSHRGSVLALWSFTPSFFLLSTSLKLPEFF